MKALYDHQGNGEIELEGDPQELLELAGFLKSEEKRLEVTFEHEFDDLAPTQTALEKLSVKVGGVGPLLISRSGTTMKLEGARDKMEMFADELRALVQDVMERPVRSVPNHVHLEYWSGHFYLDEHSIPLVVGTTEGWLR